MDTVTPFADLDHAARMEQLARAGAIAVIAHAGQTDKLMVDYIKDPEAVAASFDPTRQTLEHCAALLHDVIEDAAREGNLKTISSELLVKAGTHPEVVEIVELLTRREGDGDAYYERIRANPAARAVKLADIGTTPTLIAPPPCRPRRGSGSRRSTSTRSRYWERADHASASQPGKPRVA